MEQTNFIMPGKTVNPYVPLGSQNKANNWKTKAFELENFFSKSEQQVILRRKILHCIIAVIVVLVALAAVGAIVYLIYNYFFACLMCHITAGVGCSINGNEISQNLALTAGCKFDMSKDADKLGFMECKRVGGGRNSVTVSAKDRDETFDISEVQSVYVQLGKGEEDFLVTISRAVVCEVLDDDSNSFAKMKSIANSDVDDRNAVSWKMHVRSHSDGVNFYYDFIQLKRGVNSVKGHTSSTIDRYDYWNVSGVGAKNPEDAVKITPKDEGLIAICSTIASSDQTGFFIVLFDKPIKDKRIDGYLLDRIKCYILIYWPGPEMKFGIGRKSGRLGF